jgi:hypothetical protein
VAVKEKKYMTKKIEKIQKTEIKQTRIDADHIQIEYDDGSIETRLI